MLMCISTLVLLHVNLTKCGCQVYTYLNLEQLSSQMKSVSLTEEDRALAALGATDSEGDLGKLDFRPRISLALLLDAPNDGSDWKALAKCLSLSHLEGGLESMTSPTKELLTMYEVSICHVIIM